MRFLIDERFAPQVAERLRDSVTIEAASPGWAATTTAHTRSIIDCHLTRIGASCGSQR